MKNQYFGDINDFHKYGLLRIICGVERLRLGLCWMLTPDDEGSDGSRIGYLSAPERWRAYDPRLFDFLAARVRGSGARDVTSVEKLGVLQGTQFYAKVLTDSVDPRKTYFSEMRKRFAGADIIFFDPDNGLEVASVPFGAKNSSKYLYLREIAQVYEAKHSVLVYQHFRRKERSRFISALAATLRRSTGAMEVHSFRTAHVVFLLAPRKERTASFRQVAARVAKMWPDQFEVRRYLSKESLPAG
jgi:hypothetical protein